MKQFSLPVMGAALAASALSFPLAGGAAEANPPGFNVHVVQDEGGARFYRGGAPRKDTMEALARGAKARGKTVTLVDLRKPAYGDDKSNKGGRLSPTQEAEMARKMGFRYVHVSALDKSLPDQLRKLQKQGDIYMHCMYGVNRTGFAAARYSRAAKVKVPSEGLGKRDWKQGDAFQATLERSAPRSGRK